ncbi:hypothetical protein OIU34_23020 [Pararhizobium sp. BT-229]|uniref:hypothetical protein n=1 Tax=Pararhizobium sp. BT-229 TaxID=2986923 RepID=UPI0021F7D91A|nr:hypothetical protein [Pararhizobium sp. BT-229]MCV9964767.1 hypothetical protein [Pararhizobium sp. BT-229]
MEIDKHHADVERIERFQSLQAGQYWRAKEQIGHEGIDKDEVLLLESIKWVDGAAHTIVLRAHPLKYGTNAQYEYPDGKGGTLVRWMHWGQHSFILADFLDKFEFEPDAEAVRIRELASVQAAVDAKQAEMMDFSSNPETMARVIEDGLRKAAEKEPSENGGTNLPALSPEASRAAAAVATGSVGNALMTGMTEQKIEMLKAAAGREHLIATIKSNWIAEHSKAISDTIGKMTPFYHEKAAAALAQTEDVRNYVAKIMSGVATLDLYVGKDVYVETIRTGEPAPKGEPLTFVQSKLCVDEELAVHYDVQEWFDFRNEEKFFEVLQTNDDLVRQIFPTERCVVAVATTRRNIDYGDGLANYLINKANKQVFLLVRDGWNIHQVISPVESHLGASKLFPSRSDGDAMFRGIDGSAVKFDDIAFSEKTAKQASTTLHYKRFLILCAGLDHRLKLFGEFYDERDAMQFVTMEFQERYCRFIRDGDASASLPTTTRQPVAEWIAEKNGYLQSGSRLACNWYTLITPDTAPTACNTYERRRYSLQYAPAERVGTAIAYRDGKSLCVDVELSGENRTNFERRTFNAKVHISAYDTRWGNSEEVPFLCLDKVSPEEVEWYIHNRGSRADHITYIRLFKVAAKMLKAERAAEADTRSRMKQALVDGRIADEAECDMIVDTAVGAWRAANRGKPLPTFDGSKAPAQWKNILDQMFAIARGSDGRAEKAEEFVTALGYSPLRLSVTGEGRFVVYVSPKAEESDDRFEPHCSVHRIALDFKNGAVKERGRRWVRLQRADATEIVLKEWDGAREWFGIESSFLTLAAKQAALAPLTELRPRIEKFAGKLESAEFEALFDGWTSARDTLSAAEGRTVSTGVAYPFALVRDKDRVVKMLAVGVEHLHALLFAVAPSEEDKERIKKTYLDGYGHKAHARDVFNNTVGGAIRWRVYGFDVKDLKADDVAYFDGWKHDYKAMAKVSDVDPLIGAATAKAMETARAAHFSADLAESGASAIDQFLAIRRPDGYGPYKTEYTRLSKGGEVPPLGRWIDSVHADFEGSMRGELPKEFSGYGQAVSTHTLATKSAVEVHVAKVARKEGGRAVHHSAMPDAPQPPEGVDRWFVVKD